MPVRMPRPLQVYRLIKDKPMTAHQIGGHMQNHHSTISAWLLALQQCGLAHPVGWGERTHGVKAGMLPRVWGAKK